MKSRGPLLIVASLLTVAVILIGLDTFSSHVNVTAQDGANVVIRLNAEDVTDWSGLHSASSQETTRKYGVSQKPPTDLPEGSGNEANLTGTTKGR